MSASKISVMWASDMTYVLEVDHFGVSVVLYCDVVQQYINNPERFLCFTLKLSILVELSILYSVKCIFMVASLTCGPKKKMGQKKKLTCGEIPGFSRPSLQDLRFDTPAIVLGILLYISFQFLTFDCFTL